jgi:hypothetical protein
MNDVFIVHSGRKKESTVDYLLACLFKERLNRSDIDGYIAEDYPDPGKPIGDKLWDKISKSDVCVYIITDDYLKRAIVPNTWASREAGMIRAMEKKEYLLADESLMENEETKEIFNSLFDEKEFIPFRKENPNEGFKNMIDYIKSKKTPSFIDKGIVYAPCSDIANEVFFFPFKAIGNLCNWVVSITKEIDQMTR